MFGMSGEGFGLIIKVDVQKEIRTKRRTDGQKDRQIKMNIHRDGQTYRHYASLMFGMSGQGFCLLIKVDRLHGKLGT